MILDRRRIRSFQMQLLRWYRRRKRALPWRDTVDPYAILVSEVMLQQTPVDRVITHYADFLERFPTIFELARANRRSVLQAWSGLGFNRRAIYLHRAAQVIVSEYGGRVPEDEVMLRKLPGIGAYTSRSIPIFAYNCDSFTVDTNVRRVLLSVFSLPESLSQKEVERYAGMVVPHGRSREWHNALMDYGALVLDSKRTGILSQSRQSRFSGSRRQARGRILKELLRGRTLSLSELGKLSGKGRSETSEIVSELVVEGFLAEIEGNYRIETRTGSSKGI